MDSENQNKRFCSNCGKEISPNADVCLNCGRSVNNGGVSKNNVREDNIPAEYKPISMWGILWI